nr:reverse transcriptase domain-containing protein [Tanacetum cinerariifolium]
MATLTDMMTKLVSANTASSSGSGTLPGNTVTNPKEELKGITTRSGVAYQGPKTPSPSKQRTKVTKDQVQNPSSQNTAPVQPSVIQSESQALVSEPVVALVSASIPNLKPSIPYPSRRDNEKRHDQANEQIEKFYEIFKEMSFEISFTDALILMPKFASTLKALIGNKENLSEMARTTMNEHCSVVILNKLPRKLGDPEKFLIPCEFSRMDECLALADLGASINLMPLSVWEGLSLPELTPTCMTLELAGRSVSKPIGIAKDVSFKVGVFHFPADFVVVDFEPDPRVPLILKRCFLKTSHALIDVHKGELTLPTDGSIYRENIQEFVSQAFAVNYNQGTHAYQAPTPQTQSVLKEDFSAYVKAVIESACEEYSQEVLGFSNVTASGTPTPQNDPIVSATSPTLTLFGDSDFLLLEEADAFLGLKDDPDSPKINPFYYDPEGDIILLEAILNSKPSPPLPNQEQNLPSFKEELKAYEAQTVKSSVDEPPEVELKDLPHHLEYAFLEGDNKLHVIIAKELRSEEKAALIKVLKSHKRAIAWKLSDIQEDVYVKVGSFHFSADFVVVDFDADPQVPLILGRSFLKTGKSLIDVFEGELTLRVRKEAITFNLDQTSRYSANYNDMMTKRINVIDMDCEEYSQEVLGFSDVISSGNPTPYYDLIVPTTSPTLTLFENSDFLIEEVDAFLAIEDDPTSPEVDQSYLDPEGDILLLEAFLNDDPSLPPPT